MTAAAVLRDEDCGREKRRRSVIAAIIRANAAYSDDEFERQERLADMWQMCPLWLAFERGGNVVLLDGCLRPIIREFADEQTEIIAPDAEYHARGPLIRIHNDFGIMPGDKAAREKVLGFIEKFKLAPELRRRWKLQQQGKLPGGRGW
jgi:ParB-like chromosome segregation protein Spo0J